MLKQEPHSSQACVNYNVEITIDSILVNNSMVKKFHNNKKNHDSK